jgi:hypothetical protein
MITIYAVQTTIFHSFGPESEFINAYATKREADKHVDRLRNDEHRPNNEEYDMVEIPVEIDSNKALEQLQLWEKVGDEIMLCATGKKAPLSDSEVCGVIQYLRAQLADLQAQRDEVIRILGGNRHSNLVELASTVSELCAE